MNYLAHAYLSFGYPEVITGNLISDFVKGRKKYDYPTGIQVGITLHREIDAYTDMHAATKKAKEIFRPSYRLYSGAFVDVVYDHFLAADVTVFTGESLSVFSQEVYQIIERSKEWLPENFARMFPYMKSQDWLYNYRTIPGIQKSFGGLVRRSQHLTESETASILLEQNYEYLKGCYQEFIAEIRLFAKQRLEELHTS